MSKWVCKCCGNPCIFERKNVKILLPKWCPVRMSNDAKWEKITEDTEPAKQESELPDWCKVGEWVWDKDDGYGKIDSVRHNPSACFIVFDCGIGAFCPESFAELKQARLRPFNTDEMKSLVGKVIEHKKDLHLVINYLNDTADNEPIVCVGTNWRDAKGLIEHNYTIEANPCGVLEHLEDGEWVE